MSLLGCIFFATVTTLAIVFFDALKDFLDQNYQAKIENMLIFIVLCGLHAFALFIITIQLFVAKPTTKKVIIPLVILIATSFVLLVAIDFFIEFHLMHLTPKAVLTQTQKKSVEDKSKDKKKGKGFKMGYLIIYSSFCVIVWFVFLAYKNLEEDIEKQKKENELPPMEITISHIT
ncbi:hypothetical protein PVAND_009569 [Polypedilum vanderplanki]|uniref:Uncharacterized protein n=1 Tax=Polypedilum vanderplanki TaxID=319348 RepID=A0A9J6CEI8_POLVA|nr:hypothetical protein PVAND_009569 [Polypedilum vanderplanki]